MTFNEAYDLGYNKAEEDIIKKIRKVKAKYTDKKIRKSLDNLIKELIIK